MGPWAKERPFGFGGIYEGSCLRGISDPELTVFDYFCNLLTLTFVI
jgi:hypothetical protein